MTLQSICVILLASLYLYKIVECSVNCSLNNKTHNFSPKLNFVNDYVSCPYQEIILLFGHLNLRCNILEYPHWSNTIFSQNWQNTCWLVIFNFLHCSLIQNQVLVVSSTISSQFCIREFRSQLITVISWILTVFPFWLYSQVISWHTFHWIFQAETSFDQVATYNFFFILKYRYINSIFIIHIINLFMTASRKIVNNL